MAPWLTLRVARKDAFDRAVVILPDIGEEEFRRLRVWLRWANPGNPFAESDVLTIVLFIARALLAFMSIPHHAAGPAQSVFRSTRHQRNNIWLVVNAFAGWALRRLRPDGDRAGFYSGTWAQAPRVQILLLIVLIAVARRDPLV